MAFEWYDLTWEGRNIKKGRGFIDNLRREIPSFKITPFRIEGGGVNKNLQLIVRNPLRTDTGYLLPSDDEVEIPVATVSKQYNLVQHNDVLKALESALRKINVNPEHLEAELTLTEYGERMWVSFPLSDYDFDPGDGKSLSLRINALNSVDKTTALEINMTWYRLICENGMMSRTDARLRKIHLKSGDIERSLGEQIQEFLVKQLDRYSEDRRRYEQWYQRRIFISKLSQGKPSPGQIENWLDKSVAKMWNTHTAARAYHIAKTGYDAKFVNPVVKNRKKKVRFNELILVSQSSDQVPGSFAPVRNAYHISQVLSWLASQRGTVQQQLEWMINIPTLMDALLEQEETLTLGIN